MRGTERDTQVSRRAGREGDGSGGLTAEALAARFGQRWEVRQGACEWYALRRCGHPCPQPGVHGYRHIVRAATLEKLAERLMELDRTG
ncbi:hypothetical protein GCM10012278_61440 [Nonomuraea glycinis]|uniref:Uncharacterized protein n=1 Tax=Nonomuraea glycinis TaxID=2047744 RepID=A0A918AA33_9ACTN|nr:hypothetical protein GCM10012278_61440 [Nonomuraea glycinis]